MKAKRVAVDSSAAVKLLDQGGRIAELRAVLANTGPDACELGGSDVVAGSGFSLAAGDDVAVELVEDDTVWAICASGKTASVQVLASGAGGTS